MLRVAGYGVLGKGVVEDEDGGWGQGVKGLVSWAREMGYRQQETRENPSSKLGPD